MSLPPIYTYERSSRTADGNSHQSERISIYPGQKVINQLESDALSVWEKCNPFSTVAVNFNQAASDQKMYTAMAAELTGRVEQLHEYIKTTNPSRQEKIKLAAQLQSLGEALEEAAINGNNAAKRAVELAKRRAQQWGIAGACHML